MNVMVASHAVEVLVRHGFLPPPRARAPRRTNIKMTLDTVQSHVQVAEP
jgi:hypothetical protein